MIHVFFQRFNNRFLFFVPFIVLISSCCNCHVKEPMKKVPFLINLDIWNRYLDSPLTHDLFITQDGYPLYRSNSPEKRKSKKWINNKESSKWQIHKDAPLSMVMKSTASFTKDQRIEIWTQDAVYIVSGPLYAGRRLPFGPNCLDLRYDLYYTGETERLIRNNSLLLECDEISKAMIAIRDDILLQRQRKSLGYINIFIHFKVDSKWRDVEVILRTFLPEIKAMRGLWLGGSKGTPVLNLHDIVFRQT